MPALAVRLGMLVITPLAALLTVALSAAFVAGAVAAFAITGMAVPLMLSGTAVMLLRRPLGRTRLRALTGGGPGIATQLPALVVYDFMFQRGQLGRGAAAAVMMLLTLLFVLGPYGLWKYVQRRREARA